MTLKYPNFFENRTTPWRFADVLDFINLHFEVNPNFTYRVGEKENKIDENTNAGVVLAYAQLMDYTFNQTKALFSEHDHFAIAIPESREGKNILELNKIYTKLLQQGNDGDIRLKQFPDFFDIPEDILKLK
ncbi:MAG: hypothetical protein ACD_72C00217G0004 [uncultured bacterium]|nr:MAG: hypothetical protein ACD_72C00217G0004 [uncultured bacterium]